jgi:hypothetical protein
MDLVTLVTACALGVEPKLMHALVWHQSGGEPWAASVSRVCRFLHQGPTQQCSCPAGMSPSQHSGLSSSSTDARHIHA